ncbi:DIT2-1 [Symbiodinium natans]|uniref:DIT2-1 protein n=1 Tax=Symbiodinium natans TaxID=878477 RepID=A0A812HXA0_9DINO|nr:DIT2-1 [Symbiodinium natans]
MSHVRDAAFLPGVSEQGHSVFALFVAGIVTQPLPSAGVAFCALAVGLMTKTLTFAEGVAAFTDEVLWLVLLSFFFTKGFAKTGLGDRIALSIVRLMGRTTLGLAYGLNLAEGVLAAGMPASAARAAGVFYPLADSVAKACGSDPAKNQAKATGGFLVQSAFQATGNSSSLWLYGAAQNLLTLRLAAQLGYVVESPFTSWLKASCVPALTAMALTPLVAFWALPPEVKETPDAPKEAERKLKQMGPFSMKEAILAGVVMGMIVLWAGSSAFGIPAVHTAVLGLAVLLVSGVLTWDDCAGEKAAWTTVTWFAILVSMSAMLNKLGIVRWLAASIAAKISAVGLSGCPAFLVLLVVYVLSHYFFPSQVAHLSALYLPFIAMMVDTGTPPMVAVFSLAFASNIFASLTPYASAQAPVFFGGNYVTLKDWYRLGLIFILFNMIVWVGVGSVWWKAGHLHSAEASLFFDAVCWRDSACCCRSLAYIERALQQKRSHFLQKCLFESPTEVCLAVEKLF